MNINKLIQQVNYELNKRGHTETYLVKYVQKNGKRVTKRQIAELRTVVDKMIEDKKIPSNTAIIIV